MSDRTNGAFARRALTVPGVGVAALALALSAPIWLPLAVVSDLVRRRTRLPRARLALFALCWSWLETIGVGVAGLLWVTGQRHNAELHYRLQRWWATQVLAALRYTCGLRLIVDGLDALRAGPVLLFARHASLADSITTATLVVGEAGMRPRFVLKRELLWDPCLDIVGNRIPNHFVHRTAIDSAPELAALTRLVAGLGPGDCGVIFPEGTRANQAKRARAIERIGERDPVRARRVGELRHLLPPHPAGARSMAEGAPGADIVFGWHVGFEGLDTFAGALRAMARGPITIRYQLSRVPRDEVPADKADFGEWLDEHWLRIDRETDAALSPFSIPAAAVKGPRP